MKRASSTLIIVFISLAVLIGWAAWRQANGLLPELERDDNWNYCFATTFNHPIHCWTPNGWLSINQDRSASPIILNSPGIDGSWPVVGRELVITGYLTGRWFFEADCLAEIRNDQGQLITQGLAMAFNDWMTEELVPFEASFVFPDDLSPKRAVLVFIKDNPTGSATENTALVMPIQLNYTSQ